MKKSKKPALYLRWNYWLILAIILIVGAFSWAEKEIEQKQPSENWSMGIRLLEDLPTDERKIDFTLLPNEEGFGLGFIDKTGIHIYKFDWSCEIVAKTTFEHQNLDALKLIQIETVDKQLRVYLSDRLELEVWEVNAKSLEIEKQMVLSEYSEQFHAEGDVVFVGDDTRVLLYKGYDLLGSYTDFEDLKRGLVTVHGDEIFGAFNAADGGRVFKYDGENLAVMDLMNDASQKVYGYFKDMHIESDILTVMSSNYDRMNPGAATPLGVWQFDKNTMDSLYFQPYYHVGTDLDPIIIDASLKKVSYVLGSLQTLGRNSQVLMKYPQAAGGTFANISRYTRDNDVMIENTRLTITRQYPVGYDYFQMENQSIALWMDKEKNRTTLMASGEGEAWIQLAKSKFDVNYITLVTGALVSLLNTLFLGTVSMITLLSPYYYWIIGFFVATLLYKRFMPIDRGKKETHVFWVSVLAVSGLKVLITGFANADLKAFAHIYPFLFGSDIRLIALSIGSSLYALWMVFLFKKQHPYYDNKFMHFMMFLAFELFLFMFTTMSYFVSGLLKSNFMM